MDLAAIERGSLVVYGSYVLIGLGVFIFAKMLLQEEEARTAQENLAESGSRKASNALVKIARPFLTQYIVPMVRGKKYWDKARKTGKRKLVAAGLKDELTPDELVAFRFFLSGFFPLMMLVMRMTGTYDFTFVMMCGGVLVGWFYPTLWISSRIKQRQLLIRRAFPFVVDLLVLSVEAGLDFVGAIGKVVEKGTPGPLVDEFGQLLKEIKVGSSRGEALREMALRIDMSEMSSFCAILISADQMGASVGKILRQQSEHVRNERMMRAEKEGAKAASKIMIPVVFFILPAVILMIFGPVAVGFFYGASPSM